MEVKVVFLGDSGVGKTSIISSYITGKIQDVTKPTIGAAFVTKHEVFDKKTVELKIWDTAGQEVYRGIAPMYYRNSNIAIVVFDVTNKNSFESVSFWVNELKRNVKKISCITICGNKIDKDEDRVIYSDVASSYARENGINYCEVSALEGLGIGQLIETSLERMFENITVNEPENGILIKEKEKEEGCNC